MRDGARERNKLRERVRETGLSPRDREREIEKGEGENERGRVRDWAREK